MSDKIKEIAEKHAQEAYGFFYRVGILDKAIDEEPPQNIEEENDAIYQTDIKLTIFNAIRSALAEYDSSEITRLRGIMEKEKML